MSVSDLIDLVRANGVNVGFADLGGGDGWELRAEYDPAENTIRINRRVVRALNAGEAGGFIAHAVAHEFYHYLEHCGRIRHRQRRVSEERAERFAQALLAALA